MKIQILQGINLENDVTTIKILFDKEIDEKIIKEIKSYHPIFLKSYTINKNSLTIQSKLPHLWKEIAKVLNKGMEYKKAKKIILEKVIRQQVLSMSTISILNVADKRNEEITHFMMEEELFTRFGYAKFNRQYCLGCGQNSGVIISSSTSKDAEIAKKIQMNKYLTNILMSRLGFPAVKWEIVESKEHLQKIFKEYKKPVVMKPTSLTGGKGVNTGIKTIKEALSAFAKIKHTLKYDTKATQKNQIIIQEQIAGEDYRLLVINNKLEATTKRIPAFIEGDGKSTIKEIIEETNKDPRRDIYNPTHTLKPILIDKPLLDFLKEQHLNLEYIPKNKEAVVLRKVASMSQGGITQDFTDQVHPNIKYLAESLAETLRAYVLGIDVICKDISKPLTPKNGGIIEVNTMPEAYLNMYPVIGAQRGQIAKKFVDGLLNQQVKKIVAIGGELEEIQKILQTKKGNTGVYSNGSIYINNELIKKNLLTDKARQGLKINAYLDTIVFHYKNIDEVKKYGLGFDQVNTLYVKKSLTKEVKKFNTKLIQKTSFF